MRKVTDMSTVLVTGGTGHLGQDIVRLLHTRGHRVRILARRPGQNRNVEWIKGDLGTAAGVPEAVAGVDTVVHAATHSPAAQRGRLTLGDFFRSPTDVDIDGTRQLLAEASRADVGHFVHVSIVGVQHARLPYSRVKADAEKLVREGPVPWSIVPATPFYWLLARMLDKMADRRIWLLPSNLDTQPGDATDFAGYVVECLADGPRGLRKDFGGPEILTLVEMAREYQAARGITRRIVGLPLPGFALRAAGPQTCPDGRHGKTTWSEWLRR
jgi:uncharacterized protein YbjT (DUF2867 family)